MKGLGRWAALSLCAALASRAAAEVVTDGSIAPAGPVGGGTIGTTPVDYLITPEHGALRASNLFFSFERFSVEAGRIGVFTGPPEVQNVLARVTGSDATRVDGTLASTIDGADLWLVNPNGVVFGRGAQLAIRGAFHVSTGSFVRLADGSFYSSADPDSGGLTVAPPEAFGFLGGETGGIDVDVTGHALTSRPFERFSLVGGEISIHAGENGETGTLRAPDGRIDLVAVASDGSAPVEVGLYSGGVEQLEVSGPWLGRSVRVDRNAIVSSSGVSPEGFLQYPGAGDIAVFAESLSVEDAELRSLTGGSGRGGDMTIELTGDLELRGTSTQLTGLTAGSGVAGLGGDVALDGDGGDVTIRARNLALLDGARISTTSLLLGDAGNVDVEVSGTVRIAGRDPAGAPSGIFSSTKVAGAGGGVAIAADRLELERGGVIVSETRGSGAGGRIDVDVATLSQSGGARIDSSTRSFSDPPAAGGTIEIDASKSVLLSGRTSALDFSGITAIAQGATDTLPESTARAGDVTVRTPWLVLRDGAAISTAAEGAGDGGSIALYADTLTLDGGIISASAKSGTGGSILIDSTGSVSLVGGSLISARALGAGNAGRIEIDAGRQLTLSNAAITTESTLSDGGEIELRATKLVSLYRSDVTTSVGGGLGGDIGVDPKNMVMNESRIIARAGGGTGGNIRIVAGRLVSDYSSTVDASSDTGIDGTVEIESPEVDLNEQLEALPSDYADTAGLLRSSCAARTSAGPGSFVVHRRARASAPPDAPLDAGGGAEQAEDCPGPSN
jgi:filamentous hemagglutinin family protein